jgi:acetyl esterase
LGKNRPWLRRKAIGKPFLPLPISIMILPSVLALVLSAAGPPCSGAVAGNPAGNYLTPGALADVAYGAGLALDAYAPPGDSRPAAVVVHGSRGNKRTHVTQLFDVLERAGYAWFSVDYHAPDDVKHALEYIRCPGRFNITKEIILIGVDSGAEIALRLASHGGFAGVVAFGTVPHNPDSRFAASNFLTRCPVLMFHGTEDDEAPAAKAEELCRIMAHCEFHAVNGAIHEFENWHPDQWTWKEDLAAWLRRDRRGLWKNIVYSRPDGRELLMDAWLPEGSGRFPAVIVMHGGGWEAGDKVTYVSPVFEPLAKAGFAWFSIDYRLTPYVRVASQLEDLRTAIRYVREHADRFHVDPGRIAILGESASGHLVAQVGSQPCPDCQVQAVVAFYGVYDFTPWPQGSEDQRQTVRRLFEDQSQQTLERGSPIFQVKAGMAPVLLVQGSADELDKGTQAYAAKLKQVGARFELVRLPGAPHGMENWEGHPEWMFYKQRLVDWLKSVLGRE